MSRKSVGGSVDGNAGCVGGKYVCWWNTQNLFLEAFHSDIDDGSSDQSFETKSPFP